MMSRRIYENFFDGNSDIDFLQIFSRIHSIHFNKYRLLSKRFPLFTTHRRSELRHRGLEIFRQVSEASAGRYEIWLHGWSR